MKKYVLVSIPCVVCVTLAAVYLQRDKVTPVEKKEAHYESEIRRQEVAALNQVDEKLDVSTVKPGNSSGATESDQGLNLKNDELELQKLAVKASQALDSNDVAERLTGIFKLIDLNPEMAVEGIHRLLNRVSEDKTVEGAIVVAILTLGENTKALPDQELANIYYSYDNDNIRGRIARVLSHRGDDTLLDEHLSIVGNRLETANDGQIVETLRHLESIESNKSVPLIARHLQSETKEVRFAALAALQRSGNIGDLELATQLSLDPEIEVREMAKQVISYFLDIKDLEPSPVELSNPT